MKEIKFRAWDGKEIFQVRSMHNIHSQVNVFSDICDDKGGLGTGKPCVINNVRHLKYMQYTGLKDCLGKEIYEGDIVRSYDMKGEVVFNLGAFYIRTDIYRDDIPLYEIWNKGDGHKIGIIGNIYENPELGTM